MFVQFLLRLKSTFDNFHAGVVSVKSSSRATKTHRAESMVHVISVKIQIQHVVLGLKAWVMYCQLRCPLRHLIVVQNEEVFANCSHDV
ncbi:hypothetical protein TNCV_4110151 [Trichonephila clavipes]|nr:hypothetical protein TNCV_4110151 [Trichonephila clavipes]